MPFYYSTSADADKDGNGSINATEAAPYPQFYGNLTYNIVARGKPVGVFRALGLLKANVASLPTPIKNDFIVPIDSARYTGFSEINSYVGPGIGPGTNGRNHSTIRTPDVAALVLQSIRDAESHQPAQ
jgi:hypothetical protein